MAEKNKHPVSKGSVVLKYFLGFFIMVPLLRVLSAGKMLWIKKYKRLNPQKPLLRDFTNVVLLMQSLQISVSGGILEIEGHESQHSPRNRAARCA